MAVAIASPFAILYTQPMINFNLGDYVGEFAAIATALCWAITSTAFEDAGKKIGSVNLNLLRLLFGFVFLSIYTLITRGQLLPMDATPSTWGWLMLSGFIGVVLGDLMLFEAFVRIGARISMLIYASVPPLSALFAYIFLGESMTSIQMIGMVVTICGIALVILDGKGQKLQFNHPVAGILLAFGGAIGQAAGYIVGKYGMGNYDAFASTQIRLVAGIVSFILIFTFKGYWKTFFPIFKKPKALGSTVIGAIFGPFVGISLSLYAVQKINPGVASTLIAITPILLIPYAVFVKKETIKVRDIIGSMIAIVGVAMMFL